VCVWNISPAQQPFLFPLPFLKQSQSVRPQHLRSLGRGFISEMAAKVCRSVLLLSRSSGAVASSAFPAFGVSSQRQHQSTRTVSSWNGNRTWVLLLPPLLLDKGRVVMGEIRGLGSSLWRGLDKNNPPRSVLGRCSPHWVLSCIAQWWSAVLHHYPVHFQSSYTIRPVYWRRLHMCSQCLGLDSYYISSLHAC